MELLRLELVRREPLAITARVRSEWIARSAVTALSRSSPPLPAGDEVTSPSFLKRRYSSGEAASGARRRAVFAFTQACPGLGTGPWLPSLRKARSVPESCHPGAIASEAIGGGVGRREHLC